MCAPRTHDSTVCVLHHEHEVFSFFNRSILLIIKKEKKVTSHNIVVEALLCDNLVRCHVSLVLP